MLATIGYEKSTLADFIATLRHAGIDTLVDVRERAQSRRAGFSKTALANALNEAGIDYIHLPELGDPKPGREAARAGKMDLFRKIYGNVMDSQSARSAIEQLVEMIGEKHVCLMCFERDQRECHRKIISDELENRLGIRARHWDAVEGISNVRSSRRVFHSDQSAAASL